MEIETFDLFDGFRVTWDDVAVWVTNSTSSATALREQWCFDKVLEQRDCCYNDVLRAKVTGEFWLMKKASRTATEFVECQKLRSQPPRLMQDRFGTRDENNEKIAKFLADSIKAHKSLTFSNKPAPRRGRPRGSGNKPKPST